MSLTLICGPMFSGKSTFIIDKVMNMENDNLLVVKHHSDVRYGAEGIISHDKKMVDAIKLTTLESIFDMEEYEKINTILIDEGQFFPDLFDFVKNALYDDKEIYVAGLISDFRMMPFENMSKLFPLANDIIFKKGKCDCGNDSSFSKRITNSDKKILVGSRGYRAVCRNCF